MEKNLKINVLINHKFSQQEEHISKGEKRKEEKEERNNSTNVKLTLTQNGKSTPVQNQDLFTAYQVVSNSHCTYDFKSPLSTPHHSQQNLKQPKISDGQVTILLMVNDDR